MRTLLALLLGLALAANALCMLAAPQAWYQAVPGVASTGPANIHFIRDIGCAYLVAALGLFWLARSPRIAWPAAMAGGVFLALHALVHAWDTLAGRESPHGLAMDLLPVFVPAILVLWLAWPHSGEPEREE